MFFSLLTCVILVMPKGVMNVPFTNSQYNQCNGNNQSPIDFQTDYTFSHETCFCPTFHYESSNVGGELLNKGYEVALNLPDPHAVQLTDVPYREGTYLLHSFHIHFGSFDGNHLDAASDHTLNGYMFDGEIHLVFFNSKYVNLETAMRRRDGLVVLGYWVQRLSPDSYSNDHLSSFLRSHIPTVTTDVGLATDTDIDLSIFLNHSCDLFTYRGSLTTGECYETVRWIMFKQPLYVNYHDWHLLGNVRMSASHKYDPRKANHRPTQPLNERSVETNFGQETYC